MAKILWVDSDIIYNSAHRLRLEMEGHDVVEAKTCVEGEMLLKEQDWDLIIFETMINSGNCEEWEESHPYDPVVPRVKLTVGEIFFDRMKGIIAEKGIRPVVFSFSMNILPQLVDRFVALGMSEKDIVYKGSYIDTRKFIEFIDEKVA